MIRRVFPDAPSDRDRATIVADLCDRPVANCGRYIDLQSRRLDTGSKKMKTRRSWSRADNRRGFGCLTAANCSRRSSEMMYFHMSPAQDSVLPLANSDVCDA